jgi:hypothetical protein
MSLPTGEGLAADEELRPCQKAGKRRETARDVRRRWREHHRGVPKRGPYKIRQCHGEWAQA